MSILAVFIHLPFSNGSGRSSRSHRKMAEATNTLTNTGGFLLVPLECGKCESNCFPITSRASPATIKNWDVHYFQPRRKKEKVENRS